MAVIAIDAGTTGVRALAVDDEGHPFTSAYRELAQHYPRPGWVEHDATEIWDLAVTVLDEVVRAIDRPIAAIAITNQRETIVVWDRRTGRPLHRAIVWQDRRTASRCAALEPHLSEIRARTGLVLDPYFSATKIDWLLRNGDLDEGADLAFGTVDTWLAWNLTGGASFVTDPSNASRTMLYDIRAQRWSHDLMALFDIPIDVMADVVPSSSTFGRTIALGALPSGVPVSSMLGDQQAALFGQVCFEPGMAKNTYGTGSFVLMNVGDVCPPPSEGLLTTVAWQLDDGSFTYALEGAIFVTGAAIQWLRDGIGMITDARDIGPLAESVPDSGGVVFVPAFTGLGSPWWDPHARGAIVGLTRGSGRAELARACVEAMAYQTRDVVDAMVQASGRPLAELRVDGGASAMDLLLHLQADQLGVSVVRAATTETTALGAAYAAGVGCGLWTTADIARQWKPGARVEPTCDRRAADAGHARWLRAVERSRAWVIDD
ncbi:MAG TPA: glycerol kinase GlpK [Acidimicrobiales bacterium]|nr:glycerol kinase GlpK [Acidimicrobiales bacterium]